LHCLYRDSFLCKFHKQKSNYHHQSLLRLKQQLHLDNQRTIGLRKMLLRLVYHPISIHGLQYLHHCCQERHSFSGTTKRY
jgi:hypothetical protein